MTGRFRIGRIEPGDLDFFRKTDLGEQPNAVVVDIELVPGEAMTSTDRMGMVVVVPAFASGEKCDPPVVARVVAGLKAALAPEVRGGVDQPCGVQAER